MSRQSEFVDRCNQTHGNKFDYSETIFVDWKSKVSIKCNTCDTIWLCNPGNHVGPRKSGCPQCKANNSRLRNKTMFNTEWFIKTSVDAHKDRYDYSETTYIDNNHKVDIICKNHGTFSQWPSDHMRGIGCAQCGGSVRKTTSIFIEEASQIFPHFDYSLVDYKNAHIPVSIICPTHGVFEQKPNGILNKIGCYKCGIDRMLSTKIEKGIIGDPKDKTEYENYRRKVWRISNQQYRLHTAKINPENIPRSLLHHLDHKYSIQQGWQNQIPAETIGDWTNLQILEAKKNRQKSNKCE